MAANSLRHQRRRGAGRHFMPHLGAKALLLIAFLRHALGWQHCEIDRTDEWVVSEPDNVTKQMFMEYERRYTCSNLPGAVSAASYRFKSKCLAKTFATTDIQSCLKGRRVIFLGDSLSNQQGDSLLGMLGWHPSFLTLGDPQNKKFVGLPGGRLAPTLLQCWRDLHNYSGRSERCYDIVGSDFPLSEDRRLNSTVADPRDFVQKKRQGGDSSSTNSFDIGPHRSLQEIDLEIWQSKEDDPEEQKEEEEERGGADGDDETSVHMRMYPVPQTRDWVERSLSDFNETRSSDVFVINFGAHYHDTPEGEARFRFDTARVLNDMARFGDTATMVWREIAPTHFPSENGSYDSFERLPEAEKNGACCTGTPPLVLDRNLWVENYLRENGLEDRVKILKVYRMSYLRGAAHHTCHVAKPTVPGRMPRDVGTCPHSHEPTDCRHFSETGVIEEWNGLLLNHICPA